MPGQTFTATSSSPLPVDRVWRMLQVPKTWAAISGVEEVVEPRFDGEDLVGFGFHSTAGGRRYRGEATPGPRVMERSLQWEIATPELKGWVRVELAPSGDQTRVDVTMRVESVSVMASLGFPLISGAISNGFQDTVDAFAEGLNH